MPVSIVREDITVMAVDAIVNAVTVHLRAGGGVCGAIFAGAGHAQREAGRPELVAGQLRASYRNSLELAAERGLESMAFPLISAGIYGYPKGEALRIATEDITGFLMEPGHEMDIYLALCDGNPLDFGGNRMTELWAFID